GIALITGAGSGMGRLAARRLAAEGVPVAALDLDEQGLLETAERHQGIRTWQVDVTDASAVEAVVDEAEAELGPIERLYNSAAIMPLGRLLDQELSLLHRVMSVNYGGVVNLSRIVLPRMLARGRGDLVNFASMAGWLPTLYMGAYDASKFAVVAFTEVLYHENRNRGVRFACVCPPPVKTPLLDQARASVWPKFFDNTPHLEPGEVLDAIDRALDAGEFFVFPGRQTKLGWRMRRFFPNLLWKRIHEIEGV
ncbi:MAG: SDR family NAD(P)-dependent oxidoreductase, partial [Pseudomonadales bacterium]|nr:SDR family NAD(P)-dependent oxidoreductase [Pseudomonadales bacterium]